MTDISLLPGWAMAPETMQPLCEALLERLPSRHVQSYPLPLIQLSSMEPDLAAMAELLRPGVLVGWSLGGMLAVQLHRRFPERFPAVVTIASNACFAARPDWTTAMPSSTFKQFYADMRSEPEKTLKRFALLVTQGSEQRRSLGKRLAWDQADYEQRLNGLALLAVLDNRVPLSRSTAPMLHCLGGNDALVPIDAAVALERLAETAVAQTRVVVHPDASHAIVLEQPLWLAEQIAGFLESADV
ncbi:alpha/beta fold hydrolase [uncultured Halopseudomonas sp.]|uniref:alpha/beta fold hydrolase n=1 Tax=uncultured Halopseudomonas sp. TaxID=2901193 RepID=UPI0030EC65E8|tara:strand:- start:36296 stop:37024 length:729 start_codon:yes stop_codon:yes gene_type:complete